MQTAGDAANPVTHEHAASLVCDLVRIDSQNPLLVAGGAGEQRIAEFCVAWLAARGVDAWLEEVSPGRFNAVARVGTPGARALALCAHLDTVSIEGMTGAALDPVIRDGRVYGRGAYDMKGGVASILLAMAALAGRALGGSVTAALVADEEFASAGAAAHVSRHPADACIVTEPSEGRLIVAHKGFVWLEVQTTGVAAHGSRWQDGHSAISAMARVIAQLDTLDRDVLRSRTHPLLGPASMHCAMISGGDGWSTYAPSCTLRVERRTLPGETSTQVIDEVRAAARRAGVAVDVREVLHRSPLDSGTGSDIAAAVADAAEAVTGAAPVVAGVAFWMDTAIFADAGADTVDYGPTGAGAHAAEEWVSVESVASCADVLVRSAILYCGEADG